MNKTKSIFITATNTNIGKTYTCKFLAEKLYQKGYNVGLFKPIESGVEKVPHDGVELFETFKRVNNNFDLKLEDIVPIQLKLAAAPYVANLTENKIDFQKIKNSYEKIRDISDIVLIEGAGGLLVPVVENFFMIDFIKYLNIDKTLLITHNSLGCINDTLLNINLLEQKGLKYQWCINQYPAIKEDFEITTLPFYKKINNKIFYLDNIEELLPEIINLSSTEYHSHRSLKIGKI